MSLFPDKEEEEIYSTNRKKKERNESKAHSQNSTLLCLAGTCLYDFDYQQVCS